MIGALGLGTAIPLALVGDALAQTTGSTPPGAIVLRASGTALNGVWPRADIRVNGTRVSTITVNSATPAEYRITAAVPAGARVDVAFVNDAYTRGLGDRNLFVESVTLNGRTIVPADGTATFDRGAGARAFDGIDVLPGRTALYWNGALRLTAPQQVVIPVPTPVASKPKIGSFVERVVYADGKIDWAEWTYVANNYHKEEIVNYRLGPTYADFNPNGGGSFPTIYQPEPNGLWKGGVDRALADLFCQTSDKLPRSEAEERSIQDEGGGWQHAGQLLFVPDSNGPPDFRAGSANMRAFDGAMARKRNAAGQMETRALCMRMNASWFGDWWNRNNISNPNTPAIGRLLLQSPDLPLPPVATARGEIQNSITGFVALQNGIITAAGTGNDAYCNGFADGRDCETVLRLPPGKVPTALALSGMNEFLFATVWDVNARKGQLAVIAVGPDDPANIGPRDTGRFGWGVQSWPNIRALKLLGFVDLPMATPNTLSVSLNTGTMKFRGFEFWRGPELKTQAGRDAWNQRSGLAFGSFLPIETYWKLLAGAGYAVVGSRAENKVAIVDLRPLVNYYRKMYLTTEANWNQTANGNQGPGAAQWPYGFDHVAEQKPVVLGTLDVEKPTAVYARQPRGGTNTLSGWESGDWQELSKLVTIGSMDGTIRQYNVANLINPVTPSIAVSATPVRSWRAGANPVQITTPIAGATRTDDLFVVSRGAREVSVFNYKGGLHGTLKDSRLKDPVGLTIGPNGAGYGGTGKGYALGAQALAILDYAGKAVHSYGMFIDNYPQKYQPGRFDSFFAEQWPYLGPDGKVQQFQYGSGRTLPGKPFAFTMDEVI